MKVLMDNRTKQPLRLRLRLKVRQQLMLIFSGLLLALVLVSFVTTFSLFENSENTLWAGRQRDAARSVAAQVRNVIDQAQGVLQAVAELSQFAFIANPLQPILQTNPVLEEIAIISTSGRVIARAFRKESDLFANTDNVREAEWFSKALKTPSGLFYLGEIALSEASPPSLFLAARAADGTVIAAVLDMSILNDIVARARFGETGAVYIAEAEGEVVAHSDPALRGKFLNIAGRAELPAVEDVEYIGRLGEVPLADDAVRASDYINFQGQAVFGTSKVLNGTDIVIFVESGQEEIHEGQYRAFRILTAALGLAITIALVIVRQTIKRGIEMPLERLREGAQKVAQGNLTFQVPISYRDEIGEVTEAFNAMTHQLRERTLQKARQDIRLRAFYEVTARGGDLDSQLSAALEVGVNLLGLEIGVITRTDGDVYTVLHAHSADGSIQRGQKLLPSQTYCDLTYQVNDLVAIENMGESPYKDSACYALMGMETYIGVPLMVYGQRFGTLSFVGRAPRREPFTAFDKDFFLLIGQWVSSLLERQQDEIALRQSRGRLLQIANSLEGAIYEFFVDGDVWRIGFITQGIYMVAGITPEEITADFNAFARLIHPEDLKPFFESVNAVLIDRSNWHFEGRLYHKQTGELRWWRADSMPTFEADGRVVFKGIIFDITDRRRAEEQVQRQNEALVKANRELAVARRQAEAASKLKSQFLATMSHELRTPLNAIIGYTQLQLAGMVGEMTPEQQAYQERILVNAQHLLHLINEVLDLSKIEAGRLELAERPFSLRACLGEVMTQNKVLADNKGLAFTLEVDERLPETIIGDYGRVKQIVINLVSNAIKFTDQGSVTVRAELADANTWRIRVIDTGVGIPPHQQEVIFDEFLQAENGLDRGGTGLGLAIVRKLVLTMRGNIRLSSEVGRGSTFTVTLPLITEKHATQTLSTITGG
jgi:PAS domain S-box-containing protein